MCCLLTCGVVPSFATASASWKVSCPVCRRENVVKIEGAKSSASLSALEAAKRMPRNYALVDAIEVAAQAAPAAAASVASAGQQPPLRCIIPGCSNPVTHFCATKCKEQCDKHERDGHAAASGFADHIRGLIADKAAQLAAQERKDHDEVIAVAAQGVRKAVLEQQEITIREVKAKMQAADVELVKQRKGQPNILSGHRACKKHECSCDCVHVCVDVAVEVASQRASIADLKAMIPVLERDLMSYEQLSQASEASVKAAQEACKAKSIDLQAECDALSSLSAEETLKQMDRFSQLGSKALSDASAQLETTLQDGIRVCQPSPLLQLVRQAHTPSLLPSLAAPQQAGLARFLGNVPLVGTQARRLHRSSINLARAKLTLSSVVLIGVRPCAGCRLERHCCSRPRAMDTTRQI